MIVITTCARHVETGEHDDAHCDRSKIASEPADLLSQRLGGEGGESEADKHPGMPAEALLVTELANRRTWVAPGAAQGQSASVLEDGLKKVGCVDGARSWDARDCDLAETFPS